MSAMAHGDIFGLASRLSSEFDALGGSFWSVGRFAPFDSSDAAYEPMIGYKAFPLCVSSVLSGISA